nr:MAG TPA: hypothetical protein [Caudoviricetes sp.]
MKILCRYESDCKAGRKHIPGGYSAVREPVRGYPYAFRRVKCRRVKL